MYVDRFRDILGSVSFKSLEHLDGTPKSPFLVRLTGLSTRIPCDSGILRHCQDTKVTGEEDGDRVMVSDVLL